MTAAEDSVTGNAALSDAHVYLYGVDFLQFVLNGISHDEVSLTDEPRQDVLNTLRVIGDLVLGVSDDFQRRHALVSHLGDLQEGATLAERMRSRSGGAKSIVAVNDALVDGLVELALLTFPLQLLPPRNDEAFPHPSTFAAALHQAEASVRFARALYEEPDFRALFPDPIGGSGWDGAAYPYGVDSNVIWSHNGGGTLSLSMIAMSALEYLFTQMRLSGSFSVDDVTSHAQETVRTMRKLGEDRRAELPCLVAFTNLTVGRGQSVSVGRARLVSAEGLQGKVSMVDHSVTSILVLPAELRLLDVVPRDPAEDSGDLTESAFSRRFTHRTPTMEAASQALERELTRVRLAVALASGSDELIAPGLHAWRVLNLLAGGNSSFSMNAPVYSIAPQVHIDEDRTSAMFEWGGRVASHPESMWMGARRLLSAMTERRDPLDAFIDAVITWENMLGGGTEVTFRVSAGLALLLEPDDPARRLTVFEEIKTLYGIRSGLVHGSKEPPRGDASKHAQRAIRIAVTAMKAVYDRPELLAATSSSSRNRRLMLGN